MFSIMTISLIGMFNIFTNINEKQHFLFPQIIEKNTTVCAY